MDAYSPEILWLVIIGFIVSFVLAFGVGANDVANSYGTSVGSGVLTFRQACILATIFETAGAILLGYKVSDTMRKGIIDISLFEGSEKELMLGMLSALTGSALWLLVATYYKLPVSSTHSIVGSTVGFSLVTRGTAGLNFKVLGTIILSWFLSPVLSGLVGILFFGAIRKFIIKARNPLNAGLKALPIIYGLTVFINVLSVTLDGSKLLGMEKLELWIVLAISTTAMVIVAFSCRLFMVPWQRKKILSEVSRTGENEPKTLEILETQIIESTSKVAVEASTSDSSKTDNDGAINQLFRFLQTMTAIFSSFAHGGNDVSNSIGPLIAVWLIYSEGSVLQKSESPILILVYGGIGMCVGLCVFGRRVNETIGKNITKITPTTGFTIESSAATTVLLASKLGIPISTTHCVVGSVVFVGWFRGKCDEDESSKNSVDWSIFRAIVCAWLITLPFAGSVSALLMIIFKYLLLN